MIIWERLTCEVAQHTDVFISNQTHPSLRATFSLPKEKDFRLQSKRKTDSREITLNTKTQSKSIASPFQVHSWFIPGSRIRNEVGLSLAWTGIYSSTCHWGIGNRLIRTASYYTAEQN
jgi:hypothetical protein